MDFAAASAAVIVLFVFASYTILGVHAAASRQKSQGEKERVAWGMVTGPQLEQATAVAAAERGDLGVGVEAGAGDWVK